MGPCVSILLPTHNRADVLDYAIRSALYQTVTDFELLIVGDGCTDATADVVGAYRDPRIRWFDLPKAPLSGYANRNVALRQARGRYVAYAQHDDIWLPDHVERLARTLEASGADWAYSRPLWVGPDGAIYPSAVDLTLDDELCHFLHVENSIPSTCVMHRRSALERVGYWPEDIPDLADWHCWRRMILTDTSGRAGYCKVPTSLHFRAIWRHSADFVERALRRDAEAGWWPPILREPVADGSAQATLWHVLAHDPQLWAAAMRDAAATVIDRVAWNAMHDPLPRMDAARAAQAAAEASERSARAETERVIAAAHEARMEAAAQAIAAAQEARLANERTQASLALARIMAETAAQTLHSSREAAHAAHALVEAEAQRARGEAERYRIALTALLGSKSWRLTAPLRHAVAAWRR